MNIKCTDYFKMNSTCKRPFKKGDGFIYTVVLKCEGFAKCPASHYIFNIVKQDDSLLKEVDRVV